MLLSLPLLLLVSCGGPSPDTAEPLTFEEALEAEGFIVQEGRLDVLDPTACCAWESCYRWNPTGEYGLFYLPLSPEESSANRELDANNTHWNWRLRPDEAVVFVGQTPPPTEYFSFRSYRHEIYDEALDAHTFGFLTLGGSLNNITTQSAGDSPFDAETLVITTADAQADAAIRRAAERVGYDPATFNTDAIFAGEVKMGLDDRDDTFRMNHRIVAYDDDADKARWLSPEHSRVLRLTPVTEREIVPLARATSPDAGSEIDVLQYADVVEELRIAIADSLPNSTLIHRKSGSGVECQGACAGDATYGELPDIQIPEGSGRFIVVYGVNHVVNGKVAFQNVVIHGQDNDDSAGATSSRQWVGSARDYLPNHAFADKLYAWTFAWDCLGRDHCTQLTSGCPGLSEGEPALIYFRNYLDPATGTHAAPDELVGGAAYLVVPPE